IGKYFFTCSTDMTASSLPTSWGFDVSSVIFLSSLREEVALGQVIVCFCWQQFWLGYFAYVHDVWAARVESASFGRVDEVWWSAWYACEFLSWCFDAGKCAE